MLICLGGRVNGPRSRGVPHPMSRGGTPSQVWGGLPHLRFGGGYPIPCPGGYPSQVWGEGIPHPRSGQGGGYHLRWGTPPSGQTWDGVPPPQPDLGWGTLPLTIQTWTGYPPSLPRNVNRQTPVKTVPSRHTTYAGGNKMRCSRGQGFVCVWKSFQI